MSTIRVLFVDDEQNILDGFRNVFRKQRREWDIVVALGGAAGLEELARTPADVVVSDMRMPGMDGATFLQRVKDQYPSTVRIVLSGDADREAIIKTLPVAHQHLSKPCEAEQLIGVVNRTRSLQAYLHNPGLRTLIAGLDRLPSVPSVYLEIMNVAGRSYTTLDDITSIVERDPALVVKILQLVNSAYFGLKRELSSIREAVQYLGLDILKGLALSGQVFGTLQTATSANFSLEQLQHHSLHTARLARMIANGQRGAEEAFTAAIVHDIGEIVMACGWGDEFAQARQQALAEGRPCHEIEEETFGTNHAGVGAYLLGMWGLPLGVIEATAYHHTPRLASPEGRKLLAAVYIADILTTNLAAGGSDLATEEQFDMEFLNTCGITPDLERWNAMAHTSLRVAA